MNDDGLVIVGAGLAGAKAAEGARRAGWERPIRICGNEHFLPYERPNLSKGILTGRQPVHSSLVHADSFIVEHEIDLLLGAAASEVALDEGTVTLAGGRRLRFAKLVLATGSTPRRPPIPGAELDHVYTFRTLDDALALKDRLVPGRRVAVVGASWIGTELAAGARQRGCDVVLIGPQATPLERILGPDVGSAFATLHARNGVELRMGVGVDRILGTSEPIGVRLDDGSTTEADTVILGVGVVPNVQLAQLAGLDVDNGVLVDETLATSHPDIYAVGDIANAHNPLLGRRVRVEHWANALYQGLTGGANAAGARRKFDRIPYFYSDQFDLAMEYSGWPVPWQEVVFRGDPTSGSFVAFYLNGARVVAGANVNVPGVNSYVRTLIRSPQPVDLAMVQDPNVDPAQWLPGTPLHPSDRD